MERGRVATVASHGDKLEGVRVGTSFHVDQHGQPCVHMSGSRAVERGRGAGGASYGNKNKVLGQEHPDTLTSIGNLASTYLEQGRLKEAEGLEVQLMEI